MSGTAFSGQPVISASAIRSDDVEIDGKALVELGGDFWHTPYPIGQHGGYLLRVVTAEPGVLESDLFSVSQRYLAYRLGGTGGRGVGFELRVPEASAQAARVAALDGADSDGYVAVRIANPAGTDVLREASWDLADTKAGGKSLMGATAKLRVASMVDHDGSDACCSTTSA